MSGRFVLIQRRCRVRSLDGTVQTLQNKVGNYFPGTFRGSELSDLKRNGSSAEPGKLAHSLH